MDVTYARILEELHGYQPTPDNVNVCKIIGIVLLVFFIILVIGTIIYNCGNGSKYDTFANTVNGGKSILYNPLYTSPDIRDQGSFVYTQPMGDTDAGKHASTIQGTSGSFLPIQGRASGVFMKNSSQDNLSLPSKDIGNVGGYPNYTDQAETSRVAAGFNSFGHPFETNPNEYSNSYLLDGANRRVCNSGQKCPNLPAQDWWPTLEKDSEGFAVQASDALVNCRSKSISGCKDKKRFLASKFQPRWKSVFKKM